MRRPGSLATSVSSLVPQIKPRIHGKILKKDSITISAKYYCLLSSTPALPRDDEYMYCHVLETPPQPCLLTSRCRSPLVYYAGDAHGAWKIDKAFLEAKIVTMPHETREYTTLAALENMCFSFNVPNVLFYGDWSSRCYLLVSERPGQRIEEAWPAMQEDTKSQRVE